MSQLLPVGDKGQRYEVRQIRRDKTQMVFGWTNEEDGGTLAKSASLHPNTQYVRVLDRGDTKRVTHRMVGWDAPIADPAPDVYAPVRARQFARDQVLVLLDARHLCYRAYHTRDLTSAGGEVTSCLHGVLESTRAICEAANTRRWAMVWDGTLEYKRRLYLPYKNRHDRAMTPEEMAERRRREDAIRLVQDFMAAAGAPSIHVRDAEADDTCGIASTIWANSLAVSRICPDPKVILLTDDKDYYQLIQPGVYVWRGVRQELVDEAAFTALHGFRPSRYADYKALVGEPETGDNIPGVDGCGDVTAGKLIAVHGDIHGVLRHCEARSAPGAPKPLKIEARIAANRDNVMLSLRLSTIARTVGDLAVLGCDGPAAEAEIKRGLNAAAKTARPMGDVAPVLARLGFVKLDLQRWADACGMVR